MHTDLSVFVVHLRQSGRETVVEKMVKIELTYTKQGGYMGTSAQETSSWLGQTRNPEFAKRRGVDRLEELTRPVDPSSSAVRESRAVGLFVEFHTLS